MRNVREVDEALRAFKRDFVILGIRIIHWLVVRQYLISLFYSLPLERFIGTCISTFCICTIALRHLLIQYVIGSQRAEITASDTKRYWLSAVLCVLHPKSGCLLGWAYGGSATQRFCLEIWNEAFVSAFLETSRDQSIFS